MDCAGVCGHSCDISHLREFALSSALSPFLVGMDAATRDLQKLTPWMLFHPAIIHVEGNVRRIDFFKGSTRSNLDA